MGYAVITCAQLSGLGQFFLCISFSDQVVLQRLAVDWAEADTKGFYRLFVQSSLFQVLSR